MSRFDGLHRVVDALRAHGVEVREVNGTYRARCPIHQGSSNDSLSVQRLERKVINKRSTIEVPRHGAAVPRGHLRARSIMVSWPEE